MIKIGNVEPNCPHCGVLLEKKPTQKKKCPNCRENIFIRTRPDDREKVLVTEEQAFEIDAQWKRLSEQRLIEYEKKEREKLESNSEYKEEKDKLFKQWKREPKPNDVLWSLANKHLLQHAQNGDWGLYTSTKLDMAKILVLENQLERALQVYLEICYLDINGPSNLSGMSDPDFLKRFPAFNVKHGDFAPAIIERVKKLATELGMQYAQIGEIFLKVAETEHVNLELPVPPIEAWYLLYGALR